ncbi:MAG: GNAT family N-acetyltransferase [Elusimicrobia bacterium]|nr:GNAT family N-acetyltransferase [Candidatus Obscuribacterium magneticum]MCB4755856.1 GNAT family N-acetyltransferase [Candidatus Obscuribacterium magneticum]
MIVLDELRRMRPDEAEVFSAMEKGERPYPWSRNNFLETLHSDHVTPLVWEGDRGIYGFGVVQIVGEEAVLLNLMIVPGHRRQGRGMELLNKMSLWSKSNGARVLFLDVDPGNEPAAQLYRKVGFEIVDRRPRGYPGGESSWIMKKEL